MICFFCHGGTLALRFRSTKAPACLSVSLYSPIGHWSNITTGNLDLICHRQINARPLCQFPKREREKANEKERKEGTRGSSVWDRNWDMHFDGFNVCITMSQSHRQTSCCREIISLALIQRPIQSLQWTVASLAHLFLLYRGNGCTSGLQVLTLTTITAAVFYAWSVSWMLLATRGSCGKVSVWTCRFIVCD